MADVKRQVQGLLSAVLPHPRSRHGWSGVNFFSFPCLGCGRTTTHALTARNGDSPTASPPTPSPSLGTVLCTFLCTNTWTRRHPTATARPPPFAHCSTITISTPNRPASESGVPIPSSPSPICKGRAHCSSSPPPAALGGGLSQQSLVDGRLREGPRPNPRTQCQHRSGNWLRGIGDLHHEGQAPVTVARARCRPFAGLGQACVRDRGHLSADISRRASLRGGGMED